MLRHLAYRRGSALALLACALGAGSAAASSCGTSAHPLATPTTLVLSGGGAKGAYEAGVAAWLAERGLPIRLVAGSSAGALNAAMIAAGQTDRLEALWRGLTRDRVYSLRARVLFGGLLPGWLTLLILDRAGSLFDPAPLRELIGESLDLERIRASPVRLLVVTTDLARREHRLFDNATVTREALMAAAAVPGAFPAVDVEGALLVDGGLTGRAPVLEALAAAPDVERAVVVMSYAAEERGAAPTTVRRALEEAFEMGMIHQIRRDVELARLKFPAAELHLLTPSAPLSLRPLDFDPAGMARALERGREDARACLSGWATR
jgi:NTE family protein